MWPWSGRTRVLVWETILAPRRARRTSGAGRSTDWPLRGLRMVSLAVELSRAAGPAGLGVESPAVPPEPEQALLRLDPGGHR